MDGAAPRRGKGDAYDYEPGGRQFVVIAAGGGNEFGVSDAILAFALP